VRREGCDVGWVEGWDGGGKMDGGKKKKKAIEIPLSLLLLLLVFAHVELAEGVSIFFFLKA
jgi:hypothetical protein